MCNLFWFTDFTATRTFAYWILQEGYLFLWKRLIILFTIPNSKPSSRSQSNLFSVFYQKRLFPIYMVYHMNACNHSLKNGIVTKCFKWTFEPPHDKTKKTAVQPAKTQISLGFRHVWSEASLCAQWVAKGPSFLHADSEDADQTGRMPRLIWVFAGRTGTLLVLSCRGSFQLIDIKILRAWSKILRFH